MLNTRQFRFRLFLFWIYALCWLATLIWLSFFWQGNYLAKGVVLFLLIIGTPPATDLFTTYEKYRTLWQVNNQEKTLASQQ